MRFLLVEAAQVTVRSDPEWRSKFFHLAMRRGRRIAKVAMARRLAVRLYWMWRDFPTPEGWEVDTRHDELIVVCPTTIALSIRLEQWCRTVDSSSGNG